MMPKHTPNVPKHIWKKSKMWIFINFLSYMIIMYDHHIWSSSMIIIYDDQIWSSSMLIIYDHHIRSSYMIIMHDDHEWSSCMIFIHDHHALSSCMIIHDHHIWSYNRGHEGLGHIQWWHEGRAHTRRRLACVVPVRRTIQVLNVVRFMMPKRIAYYASEISKRKKT